MKLYQKLKDRDLVEDPKDYRELVWSRAISVNGKMVENPDFELEESDSDIKVGIFSLE